MLGQKSDVKLSDTVALRIIAFDAGRPRRESPGATTVCAGSLFSFGDGSHLGWRASRHSRADGQPALKRLPPGRGVARFSARRARRHRRCASTAIAPNAEQGQPQSC